MLKFLNFFIFQWFFIRLVKINKKVIIDFKLIETSIVLYKDVSLGGYIKNFKVVQWYELHGFIVPMSGWKNDFKKVGKQFKLKVTREKQYE